MNREIGKEIGKQTVNKRHVLHAVEVLVYEIKLFPSNGLRYHRAAFDVMSGFNVNANLCNFADEQRNHKQLSMH